MTELGDKSAGKTALTGILTRFAPIAVVAAGLILFFAFDLQRYFSLDALRENRDALRDWVASDTLRAILIFTAAYAGATAISFPGASIMTVFGGFLFGLFPGVPVIVFAATLGATVIFLAAKFAAGDLFRRKAQGFLKRMEEGFRRDELSYLFVLRLTPVFPFWAVNIGAGLLDVRLRNFLVGTFFGIIPGSFVYASIGNAAAVAFDAGENVSLQGILFKPEVLLPLVGFALLALLPMILRRLRGDEATHKDTV
ncbi:MAG: TVP38/TMEM64 family protein [Pseudomonadota bacterium]|nr:TVP38/TMEM64 family protein [Pseudomonadota bacterium]